MRKIAAALLVLFVSATVAAQPVGSPGAGRHERMQRWQDATPEQRAQWREERRQRREKWQQMSPEEREQLRRDIRDSGQALYPRERQHRSD